MRAWARIGVRIAGMRIEARGTPPRPPFLLVANHLSYIDVLALSYPNGDLVALSKSGKVLFRRPGGNDREWWVSVNHLFEARPYWRRAVELNIRTGREIRTLEEDEPQRGNHARCIAWRSASGG